MKTIIPVILVAITLILTGLPCFSWDNPCYSNTLSSKNIPRETRFTITLESRRVKAVEGIVILYDLGKEMITIRADSFASRSFLKEVQKNRCSAQEPVALVPDRKNPSGAQYRAIVPSLR
ncbi:MAG: hypothetical protein C0392_13655 [Syntrophus sp. (in: bacteria)]|nr:hypothetical protein [Syntrophus sp. (in: bacteria)]